jgi:hypothetical protein
MITFAQIDAAVKSVSGDDPETVATMTDLLTNAEFTEKVTGVAHSLSRDIMLDTLMHGETDKNRLGQAVFEGTIVSIAVTMLMAGRALERADAQSLASLVEGFGPETTTEDEEA